MVSSLCASSAFTHRVPDATADARSTASDTFRRKRLVLALQFLPLFAHLFFSTYTRHSMATPSFRIDQVPTPPTLRRPEERRSFFPFPFSRTFVENALFCFLCQSESIALFESRILPRPSAGSPGSRLVLEHRKCPPVYLECGHKAQKASLR